MIGALTSSVLQMLRLLTPNEIGRLTQEVEAKSKLKVDSAGMGEIASFEKGTTNLNLDASSLPQGNSHQAQILPFKTDLGDKKEEDAHDLLNAEVKLETEFEKRKKARLKRNLKKKKAVGAEIFYEDEEEQITEPIEEEVSSTVFLIQEKEKFKLSSKKMVTMDAMKSYKQQASLDTSQENDQDLSQSSTAGILVNKRQF